MQEVMAAITGDLRIALLLVGGVLLLALVGWEILQRRRASRADAAHLRGPLGKERDASSDELARTDPLLGTDERSLAAEAGIAVSRSGDESTGDFRREPTVTIPDAPLRDRLTTPPLVDLDAALNASQGAGRSIPLMQPPEADTPQVAPTAPAARMPGSDGASAGDDIRSPEPPKLALPEEGERVIVALRVVARGGERFSGASLRQALLGEGFVHGEMDIFHRVAADGRVLLSAASLTKPGRFDLATMDSSRFLGLNLFAVMPGPLSGRDTVDKLLLAGHTLAQRLRGDLLDSRGEALTEARLAEMRLEASRRAP